MLALAALAKAGKGGTGGSSGDYQMLNMIQVSEATNEVSLGVDLTKYNKALIYAILPANGTDGNYAVYMAPTGQGYNTTYGYANISSMKSNCVGLIEYERVMVDNDVVLGRFAYGSGAMSYDWYNTEMYMPTITSYMVGSKLRVIANDIGFGTNSTTNLIPAETVIIVLVK